MKKAIVTGSTSMVGVALVNELLNNNFKVIAITRPNSSKVCRLPNNSNVTVVEAELEKLRDLKTKIADSYDIFYHLAWDGTRKPSRDDEFIQTNNYKFTMEALKVAKGLGCTKFIGSGSQAEYGNRHSFEKETDECNPETMYGKYKLKSCADGQIFAQNNGMDFIWCRIFSAYGKYDYDKTLIMYCIDKLKKNEKLSLTSCNQMWSFTYVDDIARMLVLLGKNTVDSGIYNIANPEIKKLMDYVIELKSILSSNSKIIFGEVPYGNGGIINLHPNVNKFLNLFPDFQFTKFEDGIKSLIKN